MLKKAIIGIDAGGSKTEIKAFDIKGNTLAEAIGGSGSFSFNTEENKFRLQILIRDIMNKIKEEYEPILLIIGASGFGALYNPSSLIEEYERKFKIKTVIVNDAEIALYSIMRNSYKQGILVLSGTGSAVFGKNDDVIILHGGWGHLLGDEGGSFFLAVSALKKVIHEFEVNEDRSDLSVAILKLLNLDSVYDIKKYVYNSKKNDVAKLSIFIDELAQKGDQDAIDLIEDNASKLFDQTYSLYKKLKLKGPFPIGLQGSLIKNSKIANNYFHKKVNEFIPNAFIISNTISPIMGTYYYGVETLKWNTQ